MLWGWHFTVFTTGVFGCLWLCYLLLMFMVLVTVVSSGNSVVSYRLFLYF